MAGTIVLTTAGGATSSFPLSVSGRRLLRPDGSPFLIVGDTPWSLEVQLTHEQIDTYLDDRQSKGFNAVLFETFEHEFSDNTPKYRNAYGENPFIGMVDGSTVDMDWTAPNEAYWLTVDHCVNAALARGMLCLITPAYSGFGWGAPEGWGGEIAAASDAELQAYGAFLATRYTQPNILWVMGGDSAGDSTQRTKQWHIVTGMRSVRTDQLITGHTGRYNVASTSWAGYTGFNVDNVYSGSAQDDQPDGLCATAYAGNRPFFFIEGSYEDGSNLDDILRGAYGTVLGGGFGYFFGHASLWHFDYTLANGGPTYALANWLDTPGADAMSTFAAFFGGFEWWRLEPKIDSSLVTSSLGTSATAGRLCPALANDGSFAMVWVPASASATVNLAALAPSSVRARWFNPVTGAYTTATGSPFANSGTQNFTAPAADSVLVLDAAP